MMKLLVILAAAMAFASSAPAAAIGFEEIQHAAERYNLGVENAPSVVKALLGDERIEINISRADGTALYAGLETKNALVVKTVEGRVRDPTISVVGKEEAVKGILASDDPVAAFQQARNLGEISITGTTLSARLKVSAALASTPALRFFAGLLGK
ncbi:hypothetical protein [Candidatus Methanocrinis natronophilus]|uniref:SCP2 domain-containing protein n=1 Tax=Candidatus Methanocrinis natronophilus TaxID=3033396 RepID=A0ABT5X709_9EURY|nr:hypothetical protein [Candidatus Methanocrinis natronophilus]MDF0590352.1 hypothetical protein [Candidatus Methanocrinis natronophilus]